MEGIGVINMRRPGLSALIFLLILIGCGNGQESDDIPLIASIYATNQHLVVQNGDPMVWKNATIVIDDKYTYKAEYVPRGNESIKFEKFTDEKGVSFHPGLLKFRKVTIRVPQFAQGKDGIFEW
jgi:hypothetical protein